LQGDWSSDVCSPISRARSGRHDRTGWRRIGQRMRLSINQLVLGFGAGIGLITAHPLWATDAKIIISQIIDKDTAETVLEGPVKRSEERRVGKECWSR